MIAAVTPVPAPARVRELLGDLLGRQVDVRPGEPLTPADDRTTTVAVFVDDSLTLRLVGMADLAFSAYAGASIGLVPVGAAERAIEEGALPATLEENLREVFRTCASLLNAEGLPHVRLLSVHHPGSVPPPQVHATACTLGRRLDLEVDIAGYGTGRFSLVGMP
jgi:hypothetical protein